MVHKAIQWTKLVSHRTFKNNIKVEPVHHVGHLSLTDYICFELEQRLLASRLRQQQLQSEQDSKWLQREESALKKRYNSLCNMRKKTCQNYMCFLRLSTTGSFGSADSAGSGSCTGLTPSSTAADDEASVEAAGSAKLLNNNSRGEVHYENTTSVLELPSEEGTKV